MLKVVDKLGQPDRIRYELKHDRYGTLYVIEAFDEHGDIEDRMFLDAYNATITNSTLLTQMNLVVSIYKAQERSKGNAIENKPKTI